MKRFLMSIQAWHKKPNVFYHLSPVQKSINKLYEGQIKKLINNFNPNIVCFISVKAVEQNMQPK